MFCTRRKTGIFAHQRAGTFQTFQNKENSMYYTSSPKRRNYSITLLDLRINAPVTFTVSAEAQDDAENAAIHSAMLNANLTGRNVYFKIQAVAIEEG
jgi:hypothetical protein